MAGRPTLPEEKVSQIKGLFEEGFSLGEIARRAEVSKASVRKYLQLVSKESGQQDVTDEGSIIKAESQEKENKEKVAQAFAMFDSGETPVEVVKKLHLMPEEVQKIFRQWQNLKDLQVDEAPQLAQELEALKERLELCERYLCALPITPAILFKCENCKCTPEDEGVAIYVNCLRCGEPQWFGPVIYTTHDLGKNLLQRFKEKRSR